MVQYQSGRNVAMKEQKNDPKKSFNVSLKKLVLIFINKLPVRVKPDKANIDRHVTIFT